MSEMNFFGLPMAVDIRTPGPLSAVDALFKEHFETEVRKVKTEESGTALGWVVTFEQDQKDRLYLHFNGSYCWVAMAKHARLWPSADVASRHEMNATDTASVVLPAGYDWLHGESVVRPLLLGEKVATRRSA